MNVSNRLKELRLERNKTQKELAAHLGITRQAYNRYETGQREPGLDMLMQIADHYQVSAQVLFMSEVNLDNLDQLMVSELGALYEHKYRILDDIILYLEINQMRQDPQHAYGNGAVLSGDKLSEISEAKSHALEELKKVKAAILKRLKEDESIENKVS